MHPEDSPSMLVKVETREEYEWIMSMMDENSDAHPYIGLIGSICSTKFVIY